jgi:SAM-dependent methyltransferase
LPASPEPAAFGLPRRDRLRAQAEHYQPPAFFTVRSRGDRLRLMARRLLDPSINSIWMDLARVLPQAQGELLDVGCGAQPYRSLVPAAARYVGLDRAEAAPAFGYAIPDTLYYEGDRWPVQDRSADWILCSEVLEHVPDPAAFLAEAFRCLKPGGRVVFTVPFSARWHYIPHDYWRYTPSGLGRLFEGAGLAQVRVYARGNPLTLACHKAMSLVFPLLLGAGLGWRRHAGRALGLLASPLALAAALCACATLGWDFGDDPIGYTVLAARPEDPV